MSTVAQDLIDQIAYIDAALVAYRATVLNAITGGAQKKYQFNDGQQDIVVERQSIKEMNEIIAALMNQKQMLCIRQGTVSGSVQVRAGW